MTTVGNFVRWFEGPEDQRSLSEAIKSFKQCVGARLKSPKKHIFLELLG